MIFGRKLRNDIRPLPGSAVVTENHKFQISRGLAGSLVKTEITSVNVWKNWNFTKVHYLTDDSVSNIKHVGVLGFREGTLLYCSEDGTFSIISERKRFPVAIEDLRSFGYKQKDAIWVSLEELNIHRKAAA